jgi:hypothetical protein
VRGEHSAEEEQMAVRHPKRGKAHLIAPDWERWYLRPTTSCGLSGTPLTDSIEARRTAPKDRCKSCFRETKGARYA